MHNKDNTRKARLIAQTAEKSGVKIPHTACLNILAAINGFSSRNALARNQQESSRPSGANLDDILKKCVPGYENLPFIHNTITPTNNSDDFPKALSISTTADLMNLINKTYTDLAVMKQIRTQVAHSQTVRLFRVRKHTHGTSNYETPSISICGNLKNALRALSLPVAENQEESIGQILEKIEAFMPHIPVIIEDLTLGMYPTSYSSVKHTNTAYRKMLNSCALRNESIKGFDNTLAPEKDDVLINHSGVNTISHNMLSQAPYDHEIMGYLQDCICLGGYDMFYNYIGTTGSGKLCLVLLYECSLSGDVTKHPDKQFNNEASEICNIVKTYLPDSTRIFASAEVIPASQNGTEQTRASLNIAIPFQDLKSFFGTGLMWIRKARKFYGEPESGRAEIWTGYSITLHGGDKFATVEAQNFDQAESKIEDLLGKSNPILWIYPTASYNRLFHIYNEEN